MTRPTDKRLLSNFQIGLIAIVVTVFGFYLAFTKSIPFVSGGGYELKAVFQDAQSIRAKSPVRIAGVDVGKVTTVESLTDENGDGLDAAVVTMEIEEDAQPIREDVHMQLRPRLFLEGNLFVDVQPGTPSAEEMESGSVVPLEQTSISVQFDQVLTSLQKPVREDLQLFLKEFGDALDTYGGAEGFRESFRTSPAAYGSTAQVNEALLGREPGDLAGFLRNLGTVVSKLNSDQQALLDFVTNFRIVTGALAAEDEALEQAIAELDPLLAEGRPALAKLNSALPELRAFAREALPGTKAANRALPVATPWIGQLRQLVSKPELRGLVKDLRPTVPDLAALAKASIPFLEQNRLLSSCFNETFIPWGNTDVITSPTEAVPGPDDDPVYKLTGYGLTGVAGESRSGDANGQWFRVLGAGGTGSAAVVPFDSDSGAVSGLAENPLFVQPTLDSSDKTPFRPDIPCETQEEPLLESSVASGPTP